jgi:hypothetical protein
MFFKDLILNEGIILLALRSCQNAIDVCRLLGHIVAHKYCYY